MLCDFTAKQLGAYGESLAAAHYREKGYVVLEANYTTRHGELDLVLELGGELVFCEVKTRRQGSLASPAEAVNLHKQRRVALAAQQYLAENNLGDVPMRFDVAEVVLGDDDKARVSCIENAFAV